MYVKPGPGVCFVRYPDKPHTTLPDEGAEVPRSTYWLRRLADGSVVAAKAPRKSTTKE